MRTGRTAEVARNVGWLLLYGLFAFMTFMSAAKSVTESLGGNW